MSPTKTTAVAAVLLCFYVALEAAKRAAGFRPKLTRKIAHVCSGFAALWLVHTLTELEFISVAAFFTLFFAIARAGRLLTAIHLPDRVTYGEILYPLGMLLVGLLAFEQKFIATSAILVLTISDTAAEYVGTRRGEPQKSCAGSLAFFLSAACTLLVTAGLYGYALGPTTASKLLGVAAVATLTEALSPYGGDNATVPLVVALWLKLLF